MNIYLIDVLIVFAIAFISFFNRQPSYSLNTNGSLIIKRGKIGVLLGVLTIFFVLFLSMGLRGDFDGDTINYFYIFRNSSGSSIQDVLSHTNSIGYYLLNFAFVKISNNYLHFLLFVAAIISFSYCRFVYKYSEVPWLSMLFLLCSGSFFTGFNLMRQILVASMFSLTFGLIVEKKFIRYLIAVILISTLHTSLIFMVFAYFIPNIRWRKSSITIVIITTIILSVFFYIFSDRAFYYLTGFLYKNYANEGHYGTTEGISFFGTAKAIILALVVLVNKKYFNLDSRRDSLLYNSAIFYIVIAVCGFKLFIIQRFIHYFVPFLMISYAHIASSIKVSTKKIQFLAIVSIILFSSLINTMLYSEYYFYWENSKIFWG